MYVFRRTFVNTQRVVVSLKRALLLFFCLYVIIIVGETMKIAVNKKIDASQLKKDDKIEYIYLFDKEPLADLLKTNLHCVYYKNCEYVDINLTNYDINCIKKAKITDVDWYELPHKVDYKYAIIIPNCNNDRGNYKGKTFLQNCIESVLNQSYKNFELIFVDDMSEDTSVETVASYNDGRIHIIKNKRKRYNGGSRNVGIEYALDNLEFDYFVFLDSDDWCKHKDVLEHINTRLYNHEMMTIGCECIGMNCVNYNKPLCYEDLYSLNGHLWCTAWARIIRKDKIVYFCESTLMEDRVWTYRLADNLNFENVIALNELCYCWNRMNVTNSVSIVRNAFGDACAYCHIGHQLQLISEMKHKEMIPKIKERVNECIERASKGNYQQY